MAINLPSFASPKTQLWLQRGSVDKKWDSLEGKIRDHPFNHAVEVFLPECSSPPDVLTRPLPPYYLARGLPITHFLQPHLLNQYFRSPKLCSPVGLSVGRRIDIHNVFALIPPGKLLMSVDKDLYEELGIQGTQSQYQKHRYVVLVDLTAPSFTPGKPGYERVKRCLTHIPELQADFIFAWDDIESLSREQFMTDFKAEQMVNLEESSSLTDLRVPVIGGDFPHGSYGNGDMTLCTAEDVHTWLGAVSCGVEQAYCGGVACHEGGAPGDFVSTLTPPHPTTPGQHGTRTRWTGMVTSIHICSILRNMREVLADDAFSPAWVALSVWGFEDAPVSWRTSEHGWFLSGDNHYNVILFKTGQFWIMKTLATYDMQ